MEFLSLRPAHLHKGADLDWSLSDRDLTPKERLLRQCSRRDHAQAALAHIVNAAGDRTSLGLFRPNVRQLRNRDSEVLGEPSLPAPIAFGSCLHAGLSLREVQREVHSSDGVVREPLLPVVLQI